MEIGQHLHADFGFVRGSDYSYTDKKGTLVTSRDGYRSYCLIIDRKSRYMWIILTANKTPPIDQLRTLLTKLQSQVKSKFKTITTDLGKELSGSKAFQAMVNEPKIQYTIKTTGAYSSAQNGIIEKPNQDLARMIRSMLHGSGLGSEYWSYAIRHAVFLKNRLPHTSLGWKTPYEMMNGVRPDMRNVRVFGSHVHFMHKERLKKLDRMERSGRFMTYKGTDKIAYVIDDKTNRERVATHISFDEAFMSVKSERCPPMATALQTSGYRPEHEQRCNIKVKLLNHDSVTPVKASVEAAGYDVYSNRTVTINPGEQKRIPTGIALEIPKGYHGQLHVRSGYAVNHQLRVEAGLIDSDYRGEVYGIVSNNGQKPFTIQQSERFAQLTIIQDPSTTINISSELNNTSRNDGKFGSTGTGRIDAPTTAAAAQLEANIDKDIQLVSLSANPYIDEIEVTLSKKGNHPHLGFELMQSDQWNDEINILSCQSGTPAARLPRWRTRIRNNVLLTVNHQNVQNIQQVTDIISQSAPKANITFTIGILEKQAMNEDQGIPMLFHDQLVTIASHLQHIKSNQLETKVNPSEQKPKTAPIIQALQKLTLPTLHKLTTAVKGILPKNKQPKKKLTRKKLKMQEDWNDWKHAEWDQLDMYHGQNMFGSPCPLPEGANVLGMIWAYSVKSDGRKKARMVCNGRPSNKNTAIFGYTFAKALDHVGARIFWATAASKNYIVRGADASNAFAEAEAPKIPLYVRMNEQYRQWWTEKMKQEPIPNDFVLPVRKALQGHPEAPRAWATLIHKILVNKLQLKATTHEPCLYHGKFEGQEILFLRQVDDFAVAAPTDAIAKKVIAKIGTFMTIKIKDLGILTRYNGVDIKQSRNFININITTYIDKIVKEHQ